MSLAMVSATSVTVWLVRVWVTLGTASSEMVSVMWAKASLAMVSVTLAMVSSAMESVMLVTA